jgi:hypothetical protein
MERGLAFIVAAALAVAGCASNNPSSAPATPSTPPIPVDPRYEQFRKAIVATGVHVTPPMGEAYRRELDTCRRLRDGEYDAFDLQTFGVTGQDKQRGRIITVAIPVLCPDQQPALDLALSGTAKQSHFGDGKYVVSMVPNVRATVQPGTYSVRDTPVFDCYWERTDAQGNIVDSAFVNFAPRVTVEILPTDNTFVSEGCGEWKRIG